MLEKSIKERLLSACARVRFDAPLAPLTTWRLGGPAAALAEPESVGELAALVRDAGSADLPWWVLGGGSNVLVRDGGYAGLVIRLGRGFSAIRRLPEEAPDGAIRVEAGASARLASLMGFCQREGLTGLEFLVGIPGWAGGALAMNAGAHGDEIRARVERVHMLGRDGGVLDLDAGRLTWRYRALELPESGVILGAVFRLRPARPDAVAAAMAGFMEQRKRAQPRGVRSAGCVFRNPPEESAGRLIDRAGLKGRRRGAAWVAREHANFIVHAGDARSRDVTGLMDEVRDAVRERFGVALETEVLVIGNEPSEDRG